MVVVWIVTVWLVSLAVFVAVRAYGTRKNRPPVRPPLPPGRLPHPPAQREPSDSPSRVTDQR